MSEPINPAGTGHPDLVEARAEWNRIAHRIAGAIVRRDTDAAYELRDQYEKADQKVTLLWLRYGDETGLKGRLYPDQ